MNYLLVQDLGKLEMHNGQKLEKKISVMKNMVMGGCASHDYIKG